ncbi:MAG TPA: phosphatidate cytidylyltransferase, partial [Usitatibacter sp.]|nr:phosphatidate cytidylyltransferase [Usitatibacter sp.]
MLRTRVLTAVVILAIVVGMLFFGSAAAWSLFVLAVALIALWEWSRLARLSGGAQWVYLVLSGALGAALWVTYLRSGDLFAPLATTAFVLATLFWIALAPAWLAKKLRPAAVVCALAGWLA